MSSIQGIIKPLLDPPKALYSLKDPWLVSFHVALVMDEIWHVRNQVLQ